MKERILSQILADIHELSKDIDNIYELSVAANAAAQIEVINLENALRPAVGSVRYTTGITRYCEKHKPVESYIALRPVDNNQVCDLCANRLTDRIAFKYVCMIADELGLTFQLSPADADFALFGVK